MLQSYQKANSGSRENSNATQEQNSTCVKWNPPGTTHYKMNVDVAQAGELRWGVGIVFRNHQGEVLAAATRSIQCGSDIRVAEGMGMKLGLQLAGELCFFHIVAESDCLELINSLRHNENNLSYFQSVVHDCISINGALGSCTFSRTKREGIKVVHCLAEVACNIAKCTWQEECPPVVNSLITSDCSTLLSI